MDMEISIIMDVIADFGWTVPNKDFVSDRDHYTDELSYFTAVYTGMGIKKNHICVAVSGGVILIRFSWSAQDPPLFECPLGDPKCFEKLGVALERL